MWASRRCWWASSNRWPTPTLSPTSKPAGSWRESWLKTRSRLLTCSFQSNRVFIHLRFVLFQLEFQSNIFYLISFYIRPICVWVSPLSMAEKPSKCKTNICLNFRNFRFLCHIWRGSHFRVSGFSRSDNTWMGKLNVSDFQKCTSNFDFRCVRKQHFKI